MTILKQHYYLSCCMRCGLVYAVRPTVERCDGKQSHGYCSRCAAVEMAKLMAMKVEVRK